MNPDPPDVNISAGSSGDSTRTFGGQGPTLALDIGPALSVGSLFGGYHIEGLLGYGGTGIVYLARQSRPDREVALKVIRPGAATIQSLKRLELEAEVLGRLLHPGIAQVYEAGTADTSVGKQPFFAMELVRGVPLTLYARENRLGTRERLQLLAKVCEAVQHAHSKGVIHRDLKPSNILVTAEGQPKILDFGVARVTDHDVQVTTIHTNIGQLIGTVPYMSPEQVTGDSLSLDTRSDVYALGVIAYELLTGRMPYDLSKKLIHEAARIIREDEPTRLSSIDRTLQGDVETIVAKAMEKERGSRYQTASDLGADITRFLRDEPIIARPASASYQLMKFARRNKPLVAGVAATFVALAAGFVASSIFAVRASVQRRDAVAAREAEASLRKIAEAARAESEASEQRALRVSEFLRVRLLAVDPTVAQGMNMDLSAAVEEARTIFGDDHAAVTSMLVSWGAVLRSAGNLGEAERVLQRAIDLQRETGRQADSSSALILAALAAVLGEMRRIDEAEATYREALDLTTSTGGAGIDGLAAMHIEGRLIELLALAGGAERQQELIERWERYIERCEVALGGRDPRTVKQWCAYGKWLAHEVGEVERAKGTLEKAVNLSRVVLPTTDADRYSATRALFDVRNPFSDVPDIALSEELLALTRDRFGRTSVSHIDQLSRHSYALERAGREEESRRFMDEAQSIALSAYPAGHRVRLEATAALSFSFVGQDFIASDIERWLAEVECTDVPFDEVLSSSPYQFPSLYKDAETGEIARSLVGQLIEILVRRGAEPQAVLEARIQQIRVMEAATRTLDKKQTDLRIWPLMLDTVTEFEHALPPGNAKLLKLFELASDLSATYSTPASSEELCRVGLYHFDCADAAARSSTYTSDARFISQLGWSLVEQGRFDELRSVLAWEVLPGDRLSGVTAMISQRDRRALSMYLSRDPADFEREEKALIRSAQQAIDEQTRPVQYRRRKVDRAIQLYERWHLLDPGKGYDAKAAEWREKLESLATPEEPAP